MHRMVFVKRDSSTIMLLTNSLETRGIGLLGQTSQSRHRVANRGLLKDIIPLVEFGVASQVFQVPERFMDGISSHTIRYYTTLLMDVSLPVSLRIAKPTLLGNRARDRSCDLLLDAIHRADN